jgi:predicted deacetylase
MTFREWLNKMYGEYMLELEYENAPSRLDTKEYFRRYKWWLRREYRKSQKG